MSTQLAPYQSALMASKRSFIDIADESKFNKEAIFATQQISKNDYSISVANANPTSVKLAMLNVASIGLTLNPANAYAYLVPRDKAIMLDISYKGLIKIATDTGSIEWARADMVFEKDSFEYNGPADKPTHRAKPFGDRGAIVGVYCIAKTHKGDILTEVMGLDELEKIRAKSPAYAKSKSGVWAEWFEQMSKKAVIKRASKTWPYTDRIERLHDAIELANTSEGGYVMDAPVIRMVSQDQAATIQDSIEQFELDKAEVLALFDVESITALPASRYQEAMATIKEMAKVVEA